MIRDASDITILLLLLLFSLKQSFFHATKHDPKRPKYKRPFNIDYRERGSHARGVYVSHTGHLAHGNSKGEARGRSRHKNDNNGVVRNLEKRNVGTKEKSPKQGLTSAKYLTIELSE